MVQLALVVAMTSNNGIGLNGTLPWHPKSLRGDMNWFKTLTTNSFTMKTDDTFTFHQFPQPNLHKPCTVVMGRKTWDSIPSKFRPLSNRKNIILTRNTRDQTPTKNQEIVFVNDLQKYIQDYQSSDASNEIWFVIGGAECYKLALESGLVRYIFSTQITELHGNHQPTINCDTFFPPIGVEHQFTCVDVTTQVAQVIDGGISARVYNQESGTFEEEGLVYKMVVFVLK